MLISSNKQLSFTEMETYRNIEEGLSDCPFLGSSFKNMKGLSSKTKGSQFEKFLEEIVGILMRGAVVSKNENSEHDRVINGVKYEIKGSFPWKGSGGQFRWQQIRPGYDVDYYVFVGIYPDRAEVYQASKQEVEDFVVVQDAEGNWPYAQHGGKNKKNHAGTPDTFYIQGQPSDFPFLNEPVFVVGA